MYMPQNRFENDSLLALEQQYEDELLAEKNSKLIHEIEVIWRFISELTGKDINAKLKFVHNRWKIGERSLGLTLEHSLLIVRSMYAVERLRK